MRIDKIKPLPLEDQAEDDQIVEISALEDIQRHYWRVWTNYNTL